MTTLPPGLNNTDVDILEHMYLFGRGYGTAEILAKCLDYEVRTFNKRFKLMRKAGWVKAIKPNQYYIHSLTRQAIEMFGEAKYLERVKNRNETLDVIQDKLRMLALIGELREHKILLEQLLERYFF